MSDSPTVRSVVEDDVARLTLSHPARLNVLTMGMLEAFDAALAHIEAKGNIRAVVIDSEGERFFCAGADIREWSALSPDAMGRHWIRYGNRVFSRLASLDAVVICVVGGGALGGGLEVALASDIRLASETAHFSFPEALVGAIPGWLGCARLQALIGPGRARQMILTGERVDARRAEAWGLATEVVPPERLAARADELVALVRARSATSISVSKRLLNAALDTERFAAMHELAASVCLAGPDGAEGAAAFREKRPPNFSGHSL